MLSQTRYLKLSEHIFMLAGFFSHLFAREYGDRNLAYKDS